MRVKTYNYLSDKLTQTHIDCNCDKEGEAEASVATMEEDETPCVFENHMQVEENLVEMQRFASQNSYPAAIV
jgi:hypothetical protein